jgi:hypothetical protein
MSFLRRLEGLAGDPPKDHMHCAILTGEHSPRAIIVVVGGALLVGLVHRLRLEGALNVVLH